MKIVSFPFRCFCAWSNEKKVKNLKNKIFNGHKLKMFKRIFKNM